MGAELTLTRLSPSAADARRQRAIKQRVDADDSPGQFLLTGSALWLSMGRISESLAGRAAIPECGRSDWPSGVEERASTSVASSMRSCPCERFRTTLPEAAPGPLWSLCWPASCPVDTQALPGLRRLGSGSLWVESYLRTPPACLVPCAYSQLAGRVLAPLVFVLARRMLTAASDVSLPRTCSQPGKESSKCWQSCSILTVCSSTSNY